MTHAQATSSVLNTSTGFGTTDRYTPVKTQTLIDTLVSKGYTLTDVKKTKVRNASKEGHQKHMVRLSHSDLSLLNVGDSRPEIVIVNSHDGLSSLRLMLGIFRLICSNGMIVGQTFGQFSVRHVGDIMPQIDIGLNEIAAKLPAVSDRINQFNGLILNVSKQRELANEAVKLILPENANTVNLDSALHIRRAGDQESNLWTVFNRLQESLVRGGVQYTTTVKDETSKTVSIKNNTSRAIKSIDRQVEVNQDLWDLANQFAA